jgi:hypothetical protein
MVSGLPDFQTSTESDTIPWHAPDIFLEASAPDKLPSSNESFQKFKRKQDFSKIQW